MKHIKVYAVMCSIECINSPSRRLCCAVLNAVSLAVSLPHTPPHQHTKVCAVLCSTECNVCSGEHTSTHHNINKSSCVLCSTALHAMFAVASIPQHQKPKLYVVLCSTGCSVCSNCSSEPTSYSTTSAVRAPPLWTKCPSVAAATSRVVGSVSVRKTLRK